MLSLHSTNMNKATDPGLSPAIKLPSTGGPLVTSLLGAEVLLVKYGFLSLPWKSKPLLNPGVWRAFKVWRKYIFQPSQTGVPVMHVHSVYSLVSQVCTQCLTPLLSPSFCTYAIEQDTALCSSYNWCFVTGVCIFQVNCRGLQSKGIR